MKHPLTCWLAVLFLCGLPFCSHAQDLEPRRWSHIPVGMSFLGGGVTYIWGDLQFDPVLNARDATLEMEGIGVSWVKSFEWLGRSARFDVKVPALWGKWEGLLNEVPTVVRRQGLADPVFRLSMNLKGAPPLKGKEFMDFKAGHPVNTTVGVGLEVVAPWGDYHRDRIINLGSNRWIFRPQLGIVHQRGLWEFEATGSVFIYGDNDEFYPDQTRSQDPLWFAQGHVIRRFSRGLWASASGGYGYGGRSEVNNLNKDDKGRVRFFALSAGMSLTPRQNLKLVCVAKRSNTFIGSDLDSCGLTWSRVMGS